MASASSTSIPRYRTVLSIFLWPDRTQVAGATVDQGRLRSAERVRGKDVRVQSDARDPFCDEPRVLPCCHGLTNPPAAGEQKFAWHLAGRLEVVVHGPARR